MSEVLGGLLFLTWTTNGHGQVGSSLGGRALILAFAMMCVIAVLVLAQKLVTAKAAVDVPLALAIAGLGILIVLAPALVPGLIPPR